MSQVGQLRAPKIKALPHCPTILIFSTHIEKLQITRMREAREHIRATPTCAALMFSLGQWDRPLSTRSVVGPPVESELGQGRSLGQH